MTWRQHGLCALGVLAAVAVLYAPLRAAGFVYEDAHLSEACSAPLSWHWRAWSRQLTRATWCWQLRQTPSPQAFHAASLGLHLVVSGLVGVLMWRLTASSWAAWTVVALFALSLIHVQAVAYASSRGDLIAAVGVLSACLAALSGHWLLALAGVALGLLGKESALVAVAVVPWVAGFHVKRSWAVLVGVTLLTGLTIWAMRAWVLAPEALPGWALLQATAVVRLIGVTILPWPGWLTVDYDYGLVPIGVRLGACGCWLSLAAAAWVFRARWPLVACGLGWIVLTTLPRLIVPTPGSVLNEGQFYVPSIGLAFLVAAGLTRSKGPHVYHAA